MLPALNSGGVEQGTLEISRALVQNGHRSLVVSSGGRQVKDLLDTGATHHQFRVDKKRPWSLMLAASMRTLMLEQGVDILHLRSRMPAWIGWLAWRTMPPTTRPRLVSTVHGFYSVNAYSAIMTRGERVIAVSNAIRDYIFDRYRGVEPSKVHVIARGVDVEQYNTKYHSPTTWSCPWEVGSGNTKIITMVGRLTRLKGHEDFIALIKELQARGEDVRGVIVGGEHASRRKYAEEIRQAAQSLPITFTGHRDDVQAIMANSDLVVSLSTQPESFGRTILEALAIGRPVVGYDHGGVGEILGNMYPAGRVPLGDLSLLVQTVQSILRSPPAPPTHNPYPLNAMLNATIELYSELAAEKDSLQ
jgi:glycosyltransferase involved in cell wall biosynthesis